METRKILTKISGKEEISSKAVIRYAKAPLSHHPVIEEYPIKEFEALVRQNPLRKDFCWTEEYLSTPGSKIRVNNSRLNLISKKFRGTIDGLVICENGEVGKGVFTQRLIKKGEIYITL